MVNNPIPVEPPFPGGSEAREACRARLPHRRLPTWELL
ncbi:hypothetical protein ABIA33_001553 [Streptacidiphilus sp. MAP12-16]